MTADVASYRDLKVWQRAMDLVPKLYQLAAKLPTHERFGLAGQMRRAAVSVPANIAEGHSQRSTREFLRHLGIARASLAELETLLLIGQRLEYSRVEELQELQEAITDLGMPLSGLIRRLEAKVS